MSVTTIFIGKDLDSEEKIFRFFREQVGYPEGEDVNNWGWFYDALWRRLLQSSMSLRVYLTDFDKWNPDIAKSLMWVLEQLQIEFGDRVWVGRQE